MANDDEGSRERNADNAPEGWTADIETSVAEYNDWYLAETPGIYMRARDAATSHVEQAFALTRDFTDLSPGVFVERPDLLFAARQALAPPLARDRLVTLAEVPKGLVKCMEERNVFPRRARQLDRHLAAMAATLSSLLDAVLLPWVRTGGVPSEVERDRAVAVISDRLARAIADPAIRNRQEQRMRGAIKAFLHARGFEPTTAPTFSMPRGTYVISRDMPVKKSNGGSVGLQVDVVICPHTPTAPIIACEQKSAGDFTNVNKRRKEEAAKADGLRKTYGDEVVFVLHLLGYFDHGYLAYEAEAGIDWAWNHRLSDLDRYL